mgnify:FL=1
MASNKKYETVFSLSRLADYIGAEISGDPECQISGISTIQNAKEGEITFLSNPCYKKHLKTTKASAVIISRAESCGYQSNCLICSDPYLAYAKISQLLYPLLLPNSDEIHETAVIADNVQISSPVKIGSGVTIEENTVIGERTAINAGAFIGKGVSIGEKVTIYPNVTILDGVVIGDDCIIHSGAVIGADGLGFARSKEGWQKIAQIGKVRIGSNVEIGANTTIDRGAIGDTVIADGVKLDNLIQIAHNVKIGRNTAIAASVGIAGSTEVGENCTIAGKVGIIGHLEICADCHITAMSLVTKSIKTPGVYSSSMPALPDKVWHKVVAKIRRLAKKT